MDEYLQFVVHLLDESEYTPHQIKKEMEDNFGEDCKKKNNFQLKLLSFNFFIFSIYNTRFSC